MKRVYVAGPYTKGDVAVNVREAIDRANTLIEMGFAPYVPHLSHFLHMAHPQEYDTWLKIDFEWVLQCDAVLRLPGESRGANAEVGMAVAHDIPVFYTYRELWEEMK